MVDKGAPLPHGGSERGLTREQRAKIAGLALNGVPYDTTLEIARSSLGPFHIDDFEGEYTRIRSMLTAQELSREYAKSCALWMNAARRDLGRASGENRPAVVDDLTAERFYADFYYRNRPVVIRGFAARWQSWDAFAPQSLARTHGDVVVEVYAGRDADPLHERTRTTRSIPLREFISTVETANSNDEYMASGNRTVHGPLASLVGHIRPLPGFLTEHRNESVDMWIGPAGTVTHLHQDFCNALYVQAHGSKRFYLVPPYEAELIYDGRNLFRTVDPETVDSHSHPTFSYATVSELVLAAGDVLFLPVGWFHHVRALAPSVSVAFINFLAPNIYRSDALMSGTLIEA
jgi:ribosomal protein L16 Arg81 hydroxylase